MGVIQDAFDVAFPDAVSKEPAKARAVGGVIEAVVGFVTPEMFGAVGTGEVDDTAALIAAAAASATENRVLVGRGTYMISDKVVLSGPTDLSHATIIVTGSPDIALEVSTGDADDPTEIFYNTVVWLPKRVENEGKVGTGWTGQGIGVRVVNAHSCKVFVGNIVGFAINLRITSFSRGNSYNEYFIGHLENGEVNLDIGPGDSGGWVNENNFYGGRYSHYSNEGTDTAGTRHIRLHAAANPVNNNLFLKPSIEGNTAEYHVENGGAYNTFLQARWEATTPKVLYTGTNANHGARNFTLGGYGAQNIEYTYGGSAGGGNNTHLAAGTAMFNMGVPQLFHNGGSSTSHIHRFFEALTRPEEAEEGDWSVGHSAAALSGKRKADAAARLMLDYQNGRMYVGNGSATPTKYVGNFGSGIGVSASFSPATDNAYSLGLGSQRWTTVYAATGTINTSDERDKQDVREVAEAERAVAVRLKGLLKAFRFKEAVAAKGDDARIHFGVIAQDVKDAFEAEGLDGTRYALLCHDSWEATPEEQDSDGNVVVPAREAGERWGVRYDELLAFVVAAAT